jgi:hypothetical protein
MQSSRSLTRKGKPEGMGGKPSHPQQAALLGIFVQLLRGWDLKVPRTFSNRWRQLLPSLSEILYMALAGALSTKVFVSRHSILPPPRVWRPPIGGGDCSSLGPGGLSFIVSKHTLLHLPVLGSCPHS